MSQISCYNDRLIGNKLIRDRGVPVHGTVMVFHIIFTIPGAKPEYRLLRPRTRQ